MTVAKGSKCDLTVPAKRAASTLNQPWEQSMDLSEVRLQWGIAVFHRCAFRNDDVESDLPRLSRPSRKNILLREGVETAIEGLSSCTHQRGVSRSSRTLGAGCDGRGDARRRGAPIADCEVVAFWCPDAGIKSARMLSQSMPMTETTKPGLRGDYEGKR